MCSNTQKTEPVQVNLIASEMMTWKIANFSELPKEVDYFRDSPAFKFENTLWCVRLYPNLTKHFVPDVYVGFSLKKLSSHVSHPKLCCNLRIKGEDVSINALAFFHFDEDEKEKKQIEIVCEYFDITVSLEINVGDVVTLEYQVFCERFPVDCFETGVVTQETKDLHCLSSDLKDLLVSGKDHDVTLNVRGREFHAHLNILRARSPVFSVLLTHDMVEKNGGVVDIPDCDPCAFEQFLIYLYSGKLETLDETHMTALQYLTDKYDVGCLKGRGRSFLKTSMTSANIVEAIQFALSHCDVDLLERATDYFVKNANNVLSTVQWQCFVKNNPKQANELFIKAVKKMSEEKSLSGS